MPDRTLTTLLPDVEPIPRDWLVRAEARQLELTKPPHSLGRLEELAVLAAAIQRTLQPSVCRKRLVVFAADHGVVDEDISPYPQAVTAQMVRNLIAGGAAASVMARSVGADLTVVDVGVARPVIAAPGLLVRRVAPGTRNLARGPAMTTSEFGAAFEVGLESAADAAAAGVQMIGLGEMGIGNTTTAAAVTAALTGRSARDVTGRGTGASDEMWLRKVQVVERALALNTPDPDDAFDVLRKVGGLEIAALCGLAIGAAVRGLLVVTDGFIATAAVAAAVRLRPAVAEYIVAAHLSTEPGHAALLQFIGARPLLNLSLRLGEGTGALAAFPVIVAAVDAFREMATFESAGVANRTP